jgi:lipopolysaccharide transport system permease protein
MTDPQSAAHLATMQEMAPPSKATRARSRLLVLEPGRAEHNYWRDLWEYRELFTILSWRDVAIRYKQTVIGITWAMVRPLLTMVIFTVIFGRVARLPSDGTVPYPIMVFAGMLPWLLFSTILSDASNSLVTNANLISKVYFPRLIVPSAAGVAALVEFGIAFVLFLLMMLWFRFLPDYRIIFLPLFIALAVLASLGPALYITALNVRYRDFRFIIPFVVQFGMYLSPVGFSSAVIPAKWRLLYRLNPVVGVIDGFRWCLLRGQSELYLPGLYLNLIIIAALLWLGVSYFRKTERSFADLI